MERGLAGYYLLLAAHTTTENITEFNIAKPTVHHKPSDNNRERLVSKYTATTPTAAHTISVHKHKLTERCDSPPSHNQLSAPAIRRAVTTCGYASPAPAGRNPRQYDRKTGRAGQNYSLTAATPQSQNRGNENPK